MAELAERLIARERAAVPEALNLIDDQRPAQRARAHALLARIEAASGPTGGAWRIGMTGAPGAGKSTLLDLCVQRFRADDLGVGVIAVDPSSPRSGGALLGDRFRMRASARDRGVFVRSMAARERLGGLADATHASVEVLSVVFDVVLVESVGVGQSEGDIAREVDTTVFVAQPGAGDMLQFMKAGILEVPDIFVVNKADLGALAERSAGELSAGLGLAERKSAGWTPPVLLCSARDGTGVDRLMDAMRAHRRHLEDSGELARVRRRACEAFVREALRERYGSFGLGAIGGSEGLDARLARIDAGAFASVQRIGDEIESKLCGAPPEGHA